MKRFMKILTVTAAIVVGIGIGSVLTGVFVNSFLTKRAPAVPAAPSITREELWTEANKVREVPLALDPWLDDTAQAKCNEIVKTGIAEHDLVALQAVADKSNRILAENLAEGYTTSKEVVYAWIASPTHNKNLIDPIWERVGYGICTSKSLGTVVVQHFSN